MKASRRLPCACEKCRPHGSYPVAQESPDTSWVATEVLEARDRPATGYYDPPRAIDNLRAAGHAAGRHVRAGVGAVSDLDTAAWLAAFADIQLTQSQRDFLTAMDKLPPGQQIRFDVPRRGRPRPSAHIQPTGETTTP